MTSGQPEVAHLTPAELADAIRAMSDAGWNRLRKVAAYYCRGCPLSPDDLLQEAWVRAFDGTRHCPRNVDVVRFIAWVMRSIASDGAKAHSRREARAEKEPTDLRLVPRTGDAETFDVVSDRTPTIEDQLASSQESGRIKQAVLALFADDVTAETMVEGIMEGMDGEELRALTDLDKTAFASKRKLIRRRIDKAYPNGWKP
ncbi:MAG: sigma-70 family RNA polymerase sigma factor [Geminicoccaceae bacterium]|nr:sigma-70 family RNA polymerase sigma factor [Geminicoccaceae bacterium]